MHPTPQGIGLMQRNDLLQLWRDVMKTPPPKYISTPFMRRFIAFELQARQKGYLQKSTLKKLESLRANHGTRRGQSPELKSGGRLLREWNGTTHVVDVTDNGFVWNGMSYRSLSAIAKAITGAHWSGPRFFGMSARPDI